MELAELAARIRMRDVRALARGATLVENGGSDSARLLDYLEIHENEIPANPAEVIGITGPPGAGKSTLVSGLVHELRGEGRRVAVLAVDPSSSLTGGALLGDRIRMQDHYGDPDVFIRSIATRGKLGGVGASAHGLVRLMRAAGMDSIVLETVGVGQDEIEVARVADVTVVMLVPGLGDDIQAIKAGIMEVADVFLINKADRPGADQLEAELQACVELSERPVPILRSVASERQGLSALLEAVRRVVKTKTRGVGRSPETTVDHMTLDHIGIAVSSLDAALEFYTGALGLRAGHRETVLSEKVHTVLLATGETRVELLEPVEADSVIGRFIERRGQGLHHVALRVPDLIGSVIKLKASGARVMNEPRRGAGGHLYVFVHPASTDGVLLELIQSEGEA